MTSGSTVPELEAALDVVKCLEMSHPTKSPLPVKKTENKCKHHLLTLLMLLCLQASRKD